MQPMTMGSVAEAGRLGLFALVLGASLALSGCGETSASESPHEDGGVETSSPVPDGTDEDGSTNATGTQYFIAVHCDPGVSFPGEHDNLKAMIGAAEEREIKLTLMLTPQWADFILEEATRVGLVEDWAAAGHEIAMHHHSVYHPGTWDGYSDFEFPEYAEIMGAQKAAKQDKVGSLADLVAVLEALYPGMDAGCANDEADKRVMPDTVVKDACSGFYTTYAYPAGTRGEGDDPLWA